MSRLMLFPYRPSFTSATELEIEPAVDHLNAFNLPFLILNLLFMLRKVFKYDLDTLFCVVYLNPFSNEVIPLPLQYSIRNSLSLDLFQNGLSELHKHVILHIFHYFAFISFKNLILSSV